MKVVVVKASKFWQKILKSIFKIDWVTKKYIKQNEVFANSSLQIPHLSLKLLFIRLHG